MEKQISQAVGKRLAAMEDKKWRLKFGKYSIEVRAQVDRVIKVVLVEKDFVSCKS